MPGKMCHVIRSPTKHAIQTTPTHRGMIRLLGELGMQLAVSSSAHPALKTVKHQQQLVSLHKKIVQREGERA